MFAIYFFFKVKEKPHPYHLAPWFGVVILSHWLLLSSQTKEIWEHWLQRAFSLALKVVCVGMKIIWGKNGVAILHLPFSVEF